jgi:hypothetical protein
MKPYPGGHLLQLSVTECLDPQEKEVIKLLTRNNKSCTGPDGIPFSFYRLTATTMAPMWRDLIQEAGEKKAWPKEFFTSQLVLLPKVDTGFLAVEEFRPICITNADYRIVVRFWALWFANIANKVVSNKQHALLPGRRIDDVIEIIHDGFMEAMVHQPKVSLLQTDFFKAFDYVNWEALLHTLEEMEAPQQILNLAGKIMEDSKVIMPRIVKAERDSPVITSRTGVKQGCPISPILFIIIYNLLVVSLSRSPSVAKIEAYADNLEVLLDTADKIADTKLIFNDYCKDTGAKMNHKKCFIMSQDKDFKPTGCWESMKETNYKANSTLYLGVPISRVINPLNDWKKVLTRMAEAAMRIKRLQL